MITIRKSHERGHADHGWLKTYHTFSFAHYYDPNFVHFRHLRVLNEDYIDKGMGFGDHPHNNMEIITYLIAGELKHRDNMGHESILYPGDVQVMSAGAGIVHSEFNNYDKGQTHLIQTWILPKEKNIKPRYDQKTFPGKDKIDRIVTLVSPDGRDGSLSINQDALLYSTIIMPGKTVKHPVEKNRYVWLQVIKGKVMAAGEMLTAGDGAGLSDIDMLSLEAIEETECLIFDLN